MGQEIWAIARKWRDKWDKLMAFMNFGSDIRRMIYTTNPVEALHRIIRKLVKSKAAWVSETALIKQIFLSLTHNEKSWKRKSTWLEIYPARPLKYISRKDPATH